MDIVSLNKWTINRKIGVSVIVALALGFFIQSWLLMGHSREAMLDLAVRDNVLVSKMMAEQLGGAIRWEKADVIEELFRNIESVEGSTLVNLVAVNSEGKRIAEVRSKNFQAFEFTAILKQYRGQLAKGETVVERVDNHNVVIAPAYSGKDKELIGALAVTWSLIPIEESLASMLMTQVTATSVIVTIVSVLLLLLLRKIVVMPLKNMIHLARDLAEGECDLRKRLSVTSGDELGELSHCFNTFVGTTQEMVRKVVTTAASLSKSVADSAYTTGDISQALVQQNTNIDQVATAMTEVAAAVSEVAGNASHAAEFAAKAQAEVGSGAAIVERGMGSINQLAAGIDDVTRVIDGVAAKSHDIGSVVEVIRNIAEQTNLLALNAAIEAARAGEQGRGFAVVADEVRALATRTQHSTLEINQIVQALQASAQEAVLVMRNNREHIDSSVALSQDARGSLRAILEAIQRINDMNIQIAAAVEQQNHVNSDINRNIVNIHDEADKIVTTSSRLVTWGEDLSGLSQNLERMVNQFKV